MDVISKQEAKDRGLSRYYTGKPCVRGHITERTIYGNCIECVPLDNARHYHQNRSKAIKAATEWNKANRDKINKRKIEYSKRWRDKNQSYDHDYYLNNKDKIKTYRKANKAKRTGYERSRQARKLHATPNWLTKSDFDEMQRFYIEANIITENTGVPQQVDHIVPLLGKNVCGLHVPWNLQVITAKENNKKRNKLISD